MTLLPDDSSIAQNSSTAMEIVSRGRRLVFLAPVLLLLVCAAVVWVRWFPIPNAELVLLGARPDGSYHEWALHYRAILAQHGIKLHVQESTGSKENLDRMLDRNQLVDAAFIQAGVGHTLSTHATQRSLVSLGRVDIEPVWIIARQPGIDRLEQLEGLRVAMGSVGSGTHTLGLTLLETARVSPASLSLVSVPAQRAAAALAAGEIDVMLSVVPPHHAVLDALNVPGAYLVRLRGNAGLTQHLPFLQTRLLRRGALDPAGPSPPEDVAVLVTSTELVVRSDLDVSLQRLLLYAARVVHAQAGPFHRAGDMPARHQLEWQASALLRGLGNDRLGFFDRHFHYWWSQFTQRVLFLMLPALLIGAALSLLLRRREKFKAHHQLSLWYGELRFKEQEIESEQGASLSVRRHMLRLKSIREHLAQTHMPIELKERQLRLLAHIDFVRVRLHKLRGR